MVGELAIRDPPSPALLRRIPTLRPATRLDDIPFKYDAVIYGAHELLMTW